MPVQIIFPRRTLGLVVVMAMAVLGAGTAYVYLPAATIHIQPAQREQTVEQTIVLSTAADGPDFVNYVLPARIVEVVIEEEEQFTREGVETLEDFARGEVVLINNQDEQQPLLPKTHLRHEATGVFFLTDSPITLPPHSKMAMKVTAKEKGPRGNIDLGKFVIDKLPTHLHQSVYAESSQSFTGGITIESPLTEDELTQARDKIMEMVKERAIGQLTVEAGGAAIRSDLIKLEVEEEISAKVGSKTRDFAVRIKIKARALVVDENDVLSLTLLALRSRPGPDEEFLSYRPESFGLKIIRNDFARGEAQVQGSLTGFFAAKTGPTVFDASNLAGRTPAEVQEYFSQFKSVGQVDVELYPFWVQTVPPRKGAIEIVVNST